MPKTIEDAINIATEAHRGQKDKNGEPYIYHPIRVMLAVQTEYEKMVGVMHDIIEDTKLEIEDLADEGFSNEVIKAVKVMTKSKEQLYRDYLIAVKSNPIARAVKIADIRDNTNPVRLFKLAPETVSRMSLKYSQGLQFLLAK